MEIWTNGTVSPQMALVEGAKILRKHLNPFIQYAEPGPEIGMEGEQPVAAPPIDLQDVDLERKLNLSLAELELSVRATNCLESEGITTVRDLVIRTDEELLEVRNFGETTLKEVKTKLQERGLQLGMKSNAAGKTDRISRCCWCLRFAFGAKSHETDPNTKAPETPTLNEQ